MKGRTFKLLAAFAWLASAVSVMSSAQAEHVQAQTPVFAGLSADLLTKGLAQRSLFNRPIVVDGASLRVDSLEAQSAGTWSLTLADLDFPEPLESLSLLVTDLNGIWKRLDGPGSLSIDLTEPTRLFVAVFARAQDGFGLYHVQANFAPVPLPAAAWLLLSGLGGLAAFRRQARPTGPRPTHI
jgi:hypothetical protein